MDDTGTLIFFPRKYLWKTLNLRYLFHGIPCPFSDNFAWNSGVFHRGGGTDKKWDGPILVYIVNIDGLELMFIKGVNSEKVQCTCFIALLVLTTATF